MNMTFDQCARKAQDANAHDSAEFEIVGPNGRMKARWLDSYMGILIGDGQEGFWMARDLEDMGLHCENLVVPEKNEATN